MANTLRLPVTCTRLERLDVTVSGEEESANLREVSNSALKVLRLKSSGWGDHPHSPLVPVLDSLKAPYLQALSMDAERGSVLLPLERYLSRSQSELGFSHLQELYLEFFGKSYEVIDLTRVLNCAPSLKRLSLCSFSLENILLEALTLYPEYPPPGGFGNMCPELEYLKLAIRDTDASSLTMTNFLRSRWDKPPVKLETVAMGGISRSSVSDLRKDPVIAYAVRNGASLEYICNYY